MWLVVSDIVPSMSGRDGYLTVFDDYSVSCSPRIVRRHRILHFSGEVPSLSR